MAEAESYRLKASQSMTRGIFSRPDPISASNYYRRAADAYKMCGERTLEKLHRIASGDCQDGLGGYATAAMEYTRAAELVELDYLENAMNGKGGGDGGNGGGCNDDVVLDRRRRECRKLHNDASRMYENMGERGRAALSYVKGSFALIMGMDPSSKLDDGVLANIEIGIEMFVGDPLNDKRDYRRTGASRYVDDDDDVGTGRTTSKTTKAKKSMLELARDNVVTDSHGHECLIRAGNELLKRRMYESALYAYGAVSALLRHEGYATISLYRCYVSECVITLAMGDVVGAKRDYERVHLQDVTGYLNSRECALEEDLIRACHDMDVDALEMARGRDGPNRGAMANLDPIVRELVCELRVSGRASSSGGKGGSGGGGDEIGRTRDARVASSDPRGTKKSVPSPVPSASCVVPSSSTSTSRVGRPDHGVVGADLDRDTDARFEEMDDIMNEMGLNDVDDEDNGNIEINDGNDDDEIDLT
jgi:hypothetical protein